MARDQASAASEGAGVLQPDWATAVLGSLSSDVGAAPGPRWEWCAQAALRILRTAGEGGAGHDELRVAAEQVGRVLAHLVGVGGVWVFGCGWGSHSNCPPGVVGAAVGVMASPSARPHTPEHRDAGDE